MPHIFDPEVVHAVLAHMNDDHHEDNLLIVRANGQPDATAAQMTDLDGEAGYFAATVDGRTLEVRVPWTQSISERAEIRREVVVLYEQACEKLGVEQRPH